MPHRAGRPERRSADRRGPLHHPTARRSRPWGETGPGRDPGAPAAGRPRTARGGDGLDRGASSRCRARDPRASSPHRRDRAGSARPCRDRVRASPSSAGSSASRSTPRTAWSPSAIVSSHGAPMNRCTRPRQAPSSRSRPAGVDPRLGGDRHVGRDPVGQAGDGVGRCGGIAFAPSAAGPGRGRRTP